RSSAASSNTIPVDHVEAAFVGRDGLDAHLVDDGFAVGAERAQAAALDRQRRGGDPGAEVAAQFAVAGVTARLQQTERQRPRIEAARRGARIGARRRTVIEQAAAFAAAGPRDVQRFEAQPRGLAGCPARSDLVDRGRQRAFEQPRDRVRIACRAVAAQDRQLSLRDTGVREQQGAAAGGAADAREREPSRQQQRLYEHALLLGERAVIAPRQLGRRQIGAFARELLLQLRLFG